MYRKTIIAATLAMLTSLAVYADTVYDATPKDNQANFNADAGQTFKTGTLTTSGLSYITVDSRLAQTAGQDLWVDVYLAVYENDGSVSNWVPGNLVGVSTNSSDMLAYAGETAVWHFSGETLSDDTDYLFMFVDDGEDGINIGTALKGGSDTTDGTVVHESGNIPFSGAFDIACVVSTDTTVPPLPSPPVVITSFTATDYTVNPTDTIDLEWVTLNEDTLTLLPGVGDVTGTTILEDVVITTNITYSLIAANAGGSVTSTVSIVATPPAVITSFVADETSVLSNDTVELSWVTEFEDTLTLLPGPVDVTGETKTDVVITEDITYTLIASNAYGSATNTVFINVEEPLAEGLVTYSYGSIVAGEDDANQAGPNFGQGITISHPDGTLSTNEAALPQSVSLREVTFQWSSSNSGGADTVAYLHIYDDFGVDGTTSPTNIGNLIAVSTNAIDTAAVVGNEPLVWKFDGEDVLDKDTQYHYILATNTTAATVLDSSNLTVGGFELNVGNPYDGGDTWRANGTNMDWDMEFIVTFALGSPTGDPVTDLVITGPISGGTQMVLSWTGEAGKSYGVETNSNLIVADWQTFETGLIGDGGTLTATNSIGPDETFYRVISE